MSDRENAKGKAKVARAQRFWVATDTASYYRAFVDAARQARHCVLILAWDIDTRVDLLREDVPVRLIDLLVELATRRPELQIRVLAWNGALIYALEREMAQSLKFAWSAPPNLRFEHDDTRNQDISKHQKLVIIDDAVAFCGGVDLTRRRWDVHEHDPVDARRIDPLGGAYGPFHDVQAAVDDEAARHLGVLARARWEHVTGEALPPCDAAHDPWPDVEPDLRDVEVTICRTRPGANGGKLVEVEERYLEMIEAARRTIYIETQYLTSPRVRDAIAARLQEPDGPEVIVVTPRATDGMTEQATMNVLRWEVIDRLTEIDDHDRLRVVYPRVRDGENVDDVYVHAKVCVIDDEYLHVGSANLTTRSLRLDYECDVSARATSPDQRRDILAVRARLLAGHLGREPADLMELQSLRALLAEQLPDAPRSLEPLADDSRTHSFGFEQYADLSQPLHAPAVANDLFEDEPAAFPFVKMGVFLAATLALALVWRFTPLRELASPQQLAAWFEPFRQSMWGPPLAMAGLALLSSVGIPVTLLIFASGIALGTWMGAACALGGAVLGALLTFEVGRRLGGNTMERLMRTERAGAVLEKVNQRGFLAIAALRIVPVAPFIVVNLVAGASEVRRRDFFFATLLAMAPGTLVIVYYGSRIAHFIEGASIWALLGIAGVVAAVIALAWWLERTLDRPRREASVHAIAAGPET